MEFKDYYATMGVDRTASQDEIKRAYRKLARKLHPDVSEETDAEERFKELGEAYEVLKDPEKRAAYDQLGANWRAGQDFRPPPDWDAGFEFSGDEFGFDDAEAFSDFFESLFGRGRWSHEPGSRMRGQDHHARILIDVEDSYTGATRTITLQVPQVDDTGHVLTRERTLNVRIPKGVRRGQLIRLAGQGAAGGGQGTSGDLYLQVDFRAHPTYTVEERDVYFDLPLAPWEAALGATVKAPTPAGVVDLKIPPGSKAGARLRLKGRGLPGSRPGDMYAQLQIVLPAAKSEKAKALYKQMEQELAFNPRAGLGV